MIINSIKQKPVKAFNVDDFEYLLISVWLLVRCLFVCSHLTHTSLPSY